MRLPAAGQEAGSGNANLLKVPGTVCIRDARECIAIHLSVYMKCFIIHSILHCCAPFSYLLSTYYHLRSTYCIYLSMHSNPTQMVRPNVDMRTVSMHPFHKKGSNGTVSKFQAFAEINMKQGVTSMKSNESENFFGETLRFSERFSKFSIQQVGESLASKIRRVSTPGSHAARLARDSNKITATVCFVLIDSLHLMN